MRIVGIDTLHSNLRPEIVLVARLENGGILLATMYNTQLEVVISKIRQIGEDDESGLEKLVLFLESIGITDAKTNIDGRVEIQ